MSLPYVFHGRTCHLLRRCSRRGWHQMDYLGQLVHNHVVVPVLLEERTVTKCIRDDDFAIAQEETLVC